MEPGVHQHAPRAGVVEEEPADRRVHQLVAADTQPQGPEPAEPPVVPMEPGRGQELGREHRMQPDGGRAGRPPGSGSSAGSAVAVTIDGARYPGNGSQVGSAADDVPDLRPDGLLESQVVVVTGGGSGLGRATAIELTALGATCRRRAPPRSRSRRPRPCARTAAASRSGATSATRTRSPRSWTRGARAPRADRHAREQRGGQYMSPAEDITPEGLPDGGRAEPRGHLAR